MEFVTAGESHGPALTAIVTGVPAGVSIDIEAINRDLARRQGGYGRGGRQRIEHDTASILSGVRFSQTLGTPITLQVVNDDFANWTDRMAPVGDAPDDLKRETCPRPGHADLVGMLKIASDDARDILERSSARETAAPAASPRRYSRNLVSRSTPTCVALVPSSFRRTCPPNARPSRPRSAAALTRRRPAP